MSFFFKTFQVVVVQAIPNACAMALIDFPSFLSFKMACFSPKGSSLVFMSSFLTQMQSSQAKPKWKIIDSTPGNAVQSLTKVLSLIHFVETTANNLTFNLSIGFRNGSYES